jgi:hypothetical protein
MRFVRACASCLYPDVEGKKLSGINGACTGKVAPEDTRKKPHGSACHVTCMLRVRMRRAVLTK